MRSMKSFASGSSWWFCLSHRAPETNLGEFPGGGDLLYSGRPGLEPGMADPESAVLPIKLSPITKQLSYHAALLNTSLALGGDW